MPGGSDGGVVHVDVGRFLDAVESAPPTAALEVFATELGRQVGAEQVSFLIADFSGRSLVRLSQSPAQGPRQDEGAEQVSLDDDSSPYGRVVTGQRVQVLPEGAGARLLAPVTARGEAIGVLELLLPGPPDEELVERVASAAHALAYVVTAERRHTDLYEWGQRSGPVSLAAEIQRRLLPGSFTCVAEPFTLAAWLEPASSVGGDTFDYALDEDRLYLSMTDAMGHEVDAALLATLAVGALRNARRASGDLAEMAHAAAAAIADQRKGFGFVTGQLVSIDLGSGDATVVNAGHPHPLLARGGRVRPVELDPDPPMGVLLERGYEVQHLHLEPGDRVVFVTDGMLERNASRVDLPALIASTRHLHPRQAVQALATAVDEAAGGHLQDDATVMCLDWRGVADDAGGSTTGVGHDHPQA